MDELNFKIKKKNDDEFKKSPLNDHVTDYYMQYILDTHQFTLFRVRSFDKDTIFCHIFCHKWLLVNEPTSIKTGASKLIKTMSNDLRTCFAVQTVNLVARFKFSEMIRFDSCSFLYLIISLVHLSSRQINILPVHSYKRNILWINLFIEVDCDIQILTIKPCISLGILE